MEYFPFHIEALAEVYDLVEAIGSGFEPLYKDLLLTFAGKHKLNDTDDFFIGESLV